MFLKKIVTIALFAGMLCFSAAAGAKESSYKLYKLSPLKISNYIESTKGQKRVVFIYASWCPYCKKKMPGIMDLERMKAGSIIAISVDENQRDLTRYLKGFKTIPFKVIISEAKGGKLKKGLKKLGVKPWTGIPYLVFMDEENEIIWQGNFSVEDAKKFLFDK